jgi:phosphoserine phosphatase
LRKYTEGLSKSYNYIVAVGDGENDVPLFKIANDSIAIFPTNEVVKCSAKHCVHEEPIDSAIHYLMK